MVFGGLFDDLLLHKFFYSEHLPFGSYLKTHNFVVYLFPLNLIL